MIKCNDFMTKDIFSILVKSSCLDVFNINKHTLINNYDLVCLFSTDGAATTHSIYTISDEVDCSAIAKDLGTIDSLGGGGHAKAAGFITYDNIINAGSVIKVRKKLFSNSCKVKTSSIII